MNFLDIGKQLEKKIENTYIIEGDDEFLIEKSIKQICAVCGKEFPEINQQTFDNENFNIDQFLQCLNQMPFGADRKLVILKKIEKISAQEKEKFKSYLSNQNPTSTLVVVRNETLSFVKEGVLIDCKKLSSNVLFQFIVSTLKDKNKKITEDAVNLLMQYCSFNMTKISREIKKLSLYELENDLIKTDLIIDVVSPDEEYAIFELTEALGKKQGDKVIKILNSFLQKKEPIQNILSLISNNFRRVVFTSLSDYSDAELAEMFKVKPFAIKKSRESANNYSKAQLKKILELLIEVDFMIKSGEMQGENAIYYLVFSVLNV